MKLKRFYHFINENEVKNKRILNPIEGEKYDKFPFELKELGDLIFPHGGTVQALAETSNDDMFMIRFVDMDDNGVFRYLLYQIDEVYIIPYLHGQHSERYLLEKSNQIWLFDSDGENDFNITKVKFDSMPEKYISDEKYDIKYGTEYAKKLTDGWLPIGHDTSPGWYFKDALNTKEKKIVKFKDDFLDENGEPKKSIIDFYDGRLYKK